MSVRRVVVLVSASSHTTGCHFAISDLYAYDFADQRRAKSVAELNIQLNHRPFAVAY